MRITENFAQKQIKRLIILLRSKIISLLHVKRIIIDKFNHQKAICKCRCGKYRVANPLKLLNGKTRHCGCLGVIVNSQYHPSYYVWQTMLQRCNNPNNKAYKYYGAKGISVCNEWKTFEGFLLTFPERPSKEYSIDRRDPSRGYSPENCHWVRREFNSACNKSNTLKDFEVREIKIFLERMKPIKDIAIFYNTSTAVIRSIKNKKAYKNI